MSILDRPPIVTCDQSLEQLRSSLKELRNKEADIVTQLDAAKARARESGRFAQGTWYRRATLALRKTRADIDWHQRTLKQIERRQSYLQQQRLEAQFMHIARQRLSKDLFAQFMHEASVHINTAQGETLQ